MREGERESEQFNDRSKMNGCWEGGCAHIYIYTYTHTYIYIYIHIYIYAHTHTSLPISVKINIFTQRESRLKLLFINYFY